MSILDLRVETIESITSGINGTSRCSRSRSTPSGSRSCGRKQFGQPIRHVRGRKISAFSILRGSASRALGRFERIARIENDLFLPPIEACRHAYSVALAERAVELAFDPTPEAADLNSLLGSELVHLLPSREGTRGASTCALTNGDRRDLAGTG